MKTILPNLITSNLLRSGYYKSVLPEYYALNKYTENNPSHQKQNVFDHVVAVFTELEKILDFNFLQSTARTQIRQYLNEKFGKYTRGELLKVSTILHDIAKPVTLIGTLPGNTRCPGHEVIGSIMVKDFAPRFGLDNKGTARVSQIILYHGFMHDLLTLSSTKHNPKTYYAIPKKVAPDYYVELLLLVYADMLGSDLKKSQPAVFAERVKLIKYFLLYK